MEINEAIELLKDYRDDELFGAGGRQALGIILKELDRAKQYIPKGTEKEVAMEEIDIIELLRRVKEGKAPKRIEIDGGIYERNTDEQFCDCIDLMYEHYRGLDEPINWWIDDKDVTLDTKIKILDKPIIEEIPLIEIKHDYSNGSTNDTYEVERAITNEELARKINEIIRHIMNN